MNRSPNKNGEQTEEPPESRSSTRANLEKVKMNISISIHEDEFSYLLPYYVETDILTCRRDVGLISLLKACHRTLIVEKFITVCCMVYLQAIIRICLLSEFYGQRADDSEVESVFRQGVYSLVSYKEIIVYCLVVLHGVVGDGYNIEDDKRKSLVQFDAGDESDDDLKLGLKRHATPHPKDMKAMKQKIAEASAAAKEAKVNHRNSFDAHKLGAIDGAIIPHNPQNRQRVKEVLDTNAEPKTADLNSDDSSNDSVDSEKL